MDRDVEDAITDQYWQERVESEMLNGTKDTAKNHDRDIYLDNAAKQPPYAATVVDIVKYYTENFYNPSAKYRHTYRAVDDISEAKAQIAKMIGADKDEIFFTSGSSEGAAFVMNLCRFFGRMIYMNEGFEHPCMRASENGVFSYYVPVDSFGFYDITAIKNAVGDYPDPVISIQLVNNEIGTIQPPRLFHQIKKEYPESIIVSDLTQGCGHIDIDVHDLGIDIGFGSAQKFGGIEGCGFLYIKKNFFTRLADENVPSLILGAGQQHGIRGGTSNTIGIVCMGDAAEISMERMSQVYDDLRDCAIDLYDKILEYHIEGIELNGPLPTSPSRLPGNLNFAIRDIDGESLVQYLDTKGIMCSTGSACHADSVDPSTVLREIGVKDDYIYGSLRLSMPPGYRKYNNDYVAQCLVSGIDFLRREEV